LKDILEVHASEVVNMLLAEWNLDDALAVCRKEAREEGKEEGREETLHEVLELLKQGYRAEQIEAELSARTVETKTTGK
jgi:HD-like signal output (HDOD) protein